MASGLIRRVFSRLEVWDRCSYGLATRSSGMEMSLQGRERTLSFGFIGQGCHSCFSLDILIRHKGSFWSPCIVLGLGLCKNAVLFRLRLTAYEITNHHSFVRTFRLQASVAFNDRRIFTNGHSLEVLCLQEVGCAISKDLTSKGFLESIACPRSESHYFVCTHDKMADLEPFPLEDHMCIKSSEFTGLRLASLICRLRRGSVSSMLIQLITGPP